MPILAKRVGTNGKVTAVTLASDDPADVDIIAALGGRGSLVVLGQIGDWEIVTLATPESDTLVIGASPYLGDQPKFRASCTLTDEQAASLAKHVLTAWGIIR